jgi:hypothetical protein
MMKEKPNWLSAAQKESVFATKQGWEIRHPNGDLELLVSVKGLLDESMIPPKQEPEQQEERPKEVVRAPVAEIKSEATQPEVVLEKSVPEIVEQTTSAVSVRFANAPFTVGDTKAVNVSFEAPVELDPSFELIVSASTAGDIPAKFVSMNAEKTSAQFAFVVPKAGNVLMIKPQTLQSTQNSEIRVVVSPEAVTKSPGSKTPATRVSVK